jgi:hypothetical protein
LREKWGFVCPNRNAVINTEAREGLPRSGERMQPTAQAVGNSVEGQTSPEGAKETSLNASPLQTLNDFFIRNSHPRPLFQNFR